MSLRARASRATLAGLTLSALLLASGPLAAEESAAGSSPAMLRFLELAQMVGGVMPVTDGAGTQPQPPTVMERPVTPTPPAIERTPEPEPAPVAQRVGLDFCQQMKNGRDLTKNEFLRIEAYCLTREYYHRRDDVRGPAYYSARRGEDNPTGYALYPYYGWLALKMDHRREMWHWRVDALRMNLDEWRHSVESGYPMKGMRGFYYPHQGMGWGHDMGMGMGQPRFTNEIEEQLYRERTDGQHQPMRSGGGG